MFVDYAARQLWTFDAKGKLLVTIMSSLAPEESRSISENVTWGHGRRFTDGNVMVPCSSLLGLRSGEAEGRAVDEEQTAAGLCQMENF